MFAVQINLVKRQIISCWSGQTQLLITAQLFKSWLTLTLASARLSVSGD